MSENKITVLQSQKTDKVFNAKDDIFLPNIHFAKNLTPKDKANMKPIIVTDYNGVPFYEHSTYGIFYGNRIQRATIEALENKRVEIENKLNTAKSSKNPDQKYLNRLQETLNNINHSLANSKQR